MKTLRAGMVVAIMGTVGARGFAAVPVTGEAVEGLESFDRLMTQFIEERQIPGAALAVSRNGRLVYARGFGFADVVKKEAVQPGSRFRLASVSKPITSLAIMRLVEEGKLKLTDRPFELLKIPALMQSGQRPDPRLGDITLLELLQHRGGFDREKSADPMFQSVAIAQLCGEAGPAMPREIIRYMEGRSLDFAPGGYYAYSNFGYCVLGRVIEQASGKRYEEYVQQSILKPLGIEGMQLGRTLEKDRAAGEVRYYAHATGEVDSVFKGEGKVKRPYGAWCIEAMDAHGGWIGSAPEVVKLASALDDPVTTEAITANGKVLIFARPPGQAGRDEGKPAAVWYGCGWQVRDVARGRMNTWHTGLLDGSSTIVVRRWDGLDWAVLFNTDHDAKGEECAAAIDPLVHRAADAVKHWPEGKGRDQAWP